MAEEKRQKLTKLKDILEYLEIKEHEIIAKKPCEIFIDKEDYKENELTETSDSYILPGILEIYFPDDDKYVVLPFNYDLIVLKPEEIVDEKDFILLKYAPGEVIVKQKYKNTMINFNTTLRIFQGQAKFIKEPEQYVLLMAELAKYSVDLVHFEVIVQQIFRCKDDETKPCRLCGANYKNCEIVPIPQLPYKISWLQGIGYQNIEYAIKNSLLNEIPMKGTAFEKVILDY